MWIRAKASAGMQPAVRRRSRGDPSSSRELLLGVAGVQGEIARMRRGRTGRFESTTSGGETVRSFVPDPLPPAPALDLGGSLQQQLEQAHLALGRLDSVTTLLPGSGLLPHAYIRKEAVLSAQIEGTQSSLSDLLMFFVKGRAERAGHPLACPHAPRTITATSPAPAPLGRRSLPAP
jgi:hypothetical protein